MTPTEQDWAIRLFIYEALAAGGDRPNAAAVAARFAISAAVASESLGRLHDAHALVLRQGGGEVLMAPPLSSLPTDYRVFINGAKLYANCAWDSLGIPAMLGADATIQARHPLTRELVEYGVDAGKLRGGENALVHFALPFRRWYDDIVET